MADGSWLIRFMFTGAITVVMLYLLGGGVVAIGLAQIIKPGSSLFWVGLAAFTILFLFKRR